MPKASSDTYAKKYTDVWKTNNYKLFKYVDGNRPIRENHLRNIRNSIAEKQIEVPIVVDEEYYIYDGQNRFEACKMLKKPVYFIKIHVLTLEDIQRLNANTKNWKADDFMDSYCELGKPDYIKYRDFKEKYGLGHSESMVILSGWSKGDKSISQVFKDGGFKIKDYPKAIDIAEKITRVKQFYDGYDKRFFVLAMLKLFKNDEYNHDRFIDKLSKQSEKMKHQPDAKSYLILIEKIYNFRCKDDNKIRLFSY